MNALLDYGTSSSSDTDDEPEENEKSTEKYLKLKLPKPPIGESSLQTSVFSNPFVEAELAKAAILEKHVKMVSGTGDKHMINGKKICWNYRKGKCRFGHNCKYAHDSDLQKSLNDLEAEKEKLKQKTVVCESSGTMSGNVPPEVDVDKKPYIDEQSDGSFKKKLKRPGLSQGIVPGKKVIKMYQEQKHKDNIKK